MLSYSKYGIKTKGHHCKLGKHTDHYKPGKIIVTAKDSNQATAIRDL